MTTVLDPFRRRQVPSVAGRFLKERDRHQRQAGLMWTGTLVAMFTDHELRLLDDLGYLSQRDRDLLLQAGRLPAPANDAIGSTPCTGAGRSYDLHAHAADNGLRGQ